jgi:hypothetical protein
VDVAEDIWVDANGLVDCQFSYAFIATGTYTVAIAAGDVNPGDWDLTNNRASTTVTIIPAGNPVAFGSLQVGDEAYTYTLSQVRTGAYPIQGEYTGSQMQSYMNFYGGTTGIAGPIKRVEARVSVGADEIYASSLTNMMSYQYDDGFATVDCTDYSLTGEQVQSCVSLYRNGTSSAWFYYAHSSGTVTYYGQTLYCQTMGCNTYTTNVNRVTGWAQRYALGGGSVVRVELAFVDAADVKHVVDRGVTLEDRSAPYNYDTTSCAPYFDGLGELCVRRTSTGTVMAGGTSW